MRKSKAFFGISELVVEGVVVKGAVVEVVVEVLVMIVVVRKNSSFGIARNCMRKSIASLGISVVLVVMVIGVGVVVVGLMGVFVVVVGVVVWINFSFSILSLLESMASG